MPHELPVRRTAAVAVPAATRCTAHMLPCPPPWHSTHLTHTPPPQPTHPLIPQFATEQLCQGSPAGGALVQAVGQGGDAAKAWVAAWYFTDCVAANDAAQAFIQALSAQQPSTALTYAQNWVHACQQIGLGEGRRAGAGRPPQPCICLPGCSGATSPGPGLRHGLKRRPRLPEPGFWVPPEQSLRLRTPGLTLRFTTFSDHPSCQTGSCVTVASLSSSGSVQGEVHVHTDVPVLGGPSK